MKSLKKLKQVGQFSDFFSTYIFGENGMSTLLEVEETDLERLKQIAQNRKVSLKQVLKELLDKEEEEEERYEHEFDNAVRKALNSPKVTALLDEVNRTLFEQKTSQ